MIETDIQITAGGWRSLLDKPEEIAQRAAAAAGSAEGVPGSAEVSIVLSDDVQVHVLNREHRGVDKPTNVLAFPAPAAAAARPGAGPAFLGDIILAFETVKREAEGQNKPFANHMSHLIVHGTLHLLGYDHQDDRDAARMEAEETAILGRLGIPDPYVTDKAEETGTAPDG
jgi:probable rRNA maturation factor